MYRHLMVPLDDSPLSVDTVARAVELARTRAAALSYARVKQQLKHDTLARMRDIVAAGSDPMLGHWV